MLKKKISLLCSKGTRGSLSLKEVAQGLSTSLGYKVLRTVKQSTRRTQFKYGYSVDKLVQYNWFKEKNIPSLEFTTDVQQAIEWCSNDQTVFGRKLLNSSCGKGIVVFDRATAAAIHGCPVYTLYKKKKREFRVHVFKDQVVAVVEKRRKRDWPDTRDTKIRNLANGYIFCQEVVNEPEGLRELALRAAAISPSDFRGVDIGYNERNNELFVIEVNSAPGITGSNINKYVEALKNAV